ncbi:SRPBCC family protein [Streptomyces sp. NPDC052101]|uniref:SRPBCC family protein n=1 Tax=Streptomyces sp. NPDC052101 TaxID=3155763 RepID=UPI003441BC70
MSAFHEEIDVDRSPGDVWAYVSDPAHLPEWQESAVSVEQLDDEPFGLGSRIRITRHVGGRDMPMTMQVTEFEPPHSWGLRGIDGPVRGRVHGEVTPLADGRTRVTMDMDFEGHGIGKVLLPLVVRPQVRKELPHNEQLLKERLEQTVA